MGCSHKWDLSTSGLWKQPVNLLTQRYHPCCNASVSSYLLASIPPPTHPAALTPPCTFAFSCLTTPGEKSLNLSSVLPCIFWKILVSTSMIALSTTVGKAQSWCVTPAKFPPSRSVLFTDDRQSNHHRFTLSLRESRQSQNPAQNIWTSRMPSIIQCL